MNAKELMIDELIKINDISEKFEEKICLNDLQEENFNEEIVEVSREVIIDYLIKSGYELTDDNFKRAEKMFESMESNKIKKTLKNAGKPREFKTINHLYDLSIEELNSILNISILNVLNEIKKRSEIKYEYAVEVIRDIGGKTDISSLKRIINEYGNSGYRIVNIFTNELGKNAVSVGGIGINSTADEVVVVFEKQIYN